MYIHQERTSISGTITQDTMAVKRKRLLLKHVSPAALDWLEKCHLEMIKQYMLIRQLLPVTAIGEHVEGIQTPGPWGSNSRCVTALQRAGKILSQPVPARKSSHTPPRYQAAITAAGGLQVSLLPALCSAAQQPALPDPQLRVEPGQPHL